MAIKLLYIAGDNFWTSKMVKNKTFYNFKSIEKINITKVVFYDCSESWYAVVWAAEDISSRAKINIKNFESTSLILKMLLLINNGKKFLIESHRRAFQNPCSV